MVSAILKDVAQHIAIRPQYDNYIGGKWVAPVAGRYFDNISPIDGQVVCTIARSSAEDVELALDAAHAAKDAWGLYLVRRAGASSEPHRGPDGG